ncbi:MAG: AAA family ATPase [Deltaproteobacteria bacterium]|nr:AAA family ATPase [Deltaproteobacteria bacterium]
MSKVIAVAGKGGTGKTTMCALLVRYLVRTGKHPVLAVDADADANFADALGMATDKSIATIGKARQEFFDSKGDVPAGMPKEAYLELMLSQSLIESADIDLLVMGRPEGSGCYCYINNVLRKHLELLGKNYPYVVIDNEAGLEHLSRRTTQKIDFLLLVSDYSLNGLRAAERVRDLAREMKLQIGASGLLVNNTPESIDESFHNKIESTAIPFLGFLPADGSVPAYDIQHKPVLDLPETAPIVTAFNKPAKDIIL